MGWVFWRWMLVAIAIAGSSGCDDSAEQGTGLGSSGGPSQSDLAQGAEIANAISGVQPVNSATEAPGFGSPQDPNELGTATFVSSSTAKIDTDGDPSQQGYDPDWNGQTSGQIDGQPVNSAEYSYVVMSPEQMAASGVQIGDWAQVTNNGTGQSVWARVEDVGPAGGTGEISEAAATALGIQFQKNSWTIGNPMVTVQAFAGTHSIGGGD
jgi:hypothetical protein